MNTYYDAIVNALQGQTPRLEGYPERRQDWYGLSEVLAEHEATSGAERDKFIRAIGEIIREGEQPPTLLAEIIHFASSLDIAQVEDDVEELRHKPVASEIPLRTAVDNYLAFRTLRREGLKRASRSIGPENLQFR
jgi:hypothetical protein